MDATDTGTVIDFAAARQARRLASIPRRVVAARAAAKTRPAFPGPAPEDFVRDADGMVRFMPTLLRHWARFIPFWAVVGAVWALGYFVLHHWR